MKFKFKIGDKVYFNENGYINPLSIGTVLKTIQSQSNPEEKNYFISWADLEDKYNDWWSSEFLIPAKDPNDILKDLL